MFRQPRVKKQNKSANYDHIESFMSELILTDDEKSIADDSSNTKTLGEEFEAALIKVQTFLGFSELSQLSQAVDALLLDETLADFSSRIIHVLSKTVKSTMSMILRSKYEQAIRLHQSIYELLANGNLERRHYPELTDGYVKEILLQRIAHFANLELIVIQNMHLLFDTIYTNNNINAIGVRIAKYLIQHPTEIDSIFNRSNNLTDFLPEKHFALFIHPKALWGTDYYREFKDKTHPDFIERELNDVYPVDLIPQAERAKLCETILTVRQNMIQIFDQMAESDHQLLQYCEENHYEADPLFALNKALVIDVLMHCTSSESTKDKPFDSTADYFILQKLNSVNAISSWIELKDSEQKLVPIAKLHAKYNRKLKNADPNLLINYVASILQPLDVPEVKKLMIEIIGPKSMSRLVQSGQKYLPHLKQYTPDKIVKEIQAFYKKYSKLVIGILDLTEKSQKDGLAGIRSTIKNYINTSETGLLSYLTHFTTWSSEKYEILIQTEYKRIKTLIQCGLTKEAASRVSTHSEMHLFFLLALKNDQCAFAMDILDCYTARFNSVSDFVPLEVKDQEKYLSLAIKLAKNNSQHAMTLLMKMLELPSWNKKLLTTFSKEEKDPAIRTLFEPNKSIKLLTGAHATAEETLPEDKLSDLENEDDLTLQQANLTFFKSVSLTNDDPIYRIQVFTEIKQEGDECNIQCYALVLCFIQFFNSYHLAGTNDRFPHLSAEDARRIRNALVHQYNYSGSAKGFLLDGEMANVLTFATALVKASKFKDSSALLKHPLFWKLLDHGNTLAAQQAVGEREHVQFYHRLCFTQWLSQATLSVNKMKASNKLSPSMIEHAIAALNILKQLYCLKNSGASLTECEAEQAKWLRHLKFNLNSKREKNAFSRHIPVGSGFR